MPVLDSHLHLWDPAVLDYPWLDGALNRRYATGELRAVAEPGETAVFVQAGCMDEQYVDEVRWVMATADAAGVVGIVAGARLDRGAETTAYLRALAEYDLVVGVRHLLQEEPVGFARTSAFLAGAQAVAERGWTFDACVRAHQLGDVAALAASVPDLRIVLDHLGKPAVGTGIPDAAWLDDIAAVARHPQVFCKISGLPAEAGGDWTAAQLVPFLDAALDAFGAERLMWGSDWPVSAIAADGYDPSARTAWIDAVADWAADRGIDHDALFGGTAAAFYRLS